MIAGLDVKGNQNRKEAFGKLIRVGIFICATSQSEGYCASARYLAGWNAGYAMSLKTRNRACSCIAAISLLAPGVRAESWPMFRGSPALLGVANGRLPGKLSLLWSFKTGGPVKSSPAIEQNQVFFGSGDGNVYALSFADGKKLWEAKTGGAIESSPLVLENKVYIGSSDSWLYAFETTSGKVSWKYQTGEKILGAPNWIKAGNELRILVGSYDFKLHCVESAPWQTRRNAT